MNSGQSWYFCAMSMFLPLLFFGAAAGTQLTVKAALVRDIVNQ